MTAIIAYTAIGLLFALPFAARWAGRLDPVATKGTWGFRLFLIPGAVLLWPWLALKVVRARSTS